jgi:hypothetical protein
MKVAVRHAAQAARGSVGPPVKPGQLGVRAGFIEENELGNGPSGLPALPLLAGPREVGAVLLRGAQRFFSSFRHAEYATD